MNGDSCLHKKDVSVNQLPEKKSSGRGAAVCSKTKYEPGKLSVASLVFVHY